MAYSISNSEKHRKYINEHNRLADLFTTDRFAFEMERKRIIKETINNMSGSEEFKEKMRAQQKKLDKMLKGAGSAENRLALIQALFWDHVVNSWELAMQNSIHTLNSFKRSKHDRPALSLVRKSVTHH